MARILGSITGYVITLGSFAAWITHVMFCLQLREWGFLIAGALFFPIAIVHGIGIWLGIWH